MLLGDAAAFRHQQIEERPPTALHGFRGLDASIHWVRWFQRIVPGIQSLIDARQRGERGVAQGEPAGGGDERERVGHDGSVLPFDDAAGKFLLGRRIDRTVDTRQVDQSDGRSEFGTAAALKQADCDTGIVGGVKVSAGERIHQGGCALANWTRTSWADAAWARLARIRNGRASMDAGFKEFCFLESRVQNGLVLQEV